ncbi:MAG: 60S ribosomal protein L22 [Candidatus Ranarchaeia archaeon]|jgi:hypothetical protein
MSKVKDSSQHKVRIDAMGLPSALVKELRSALKEKYGEEVTIRTDGKKITLTASEKLISKTKIKLVLKKFLHKQEIRSLVKIIRSDRETLQLYRPGFEEDKS